MNRWIADFCLYIASEKGLSINTVEAYQRDLIAFFTYLKQEGISKVDQITVNHIINYLDTMHQNGYATASISRALIAIKVFFNFLKRERILEKNIALYIDTPKLWQLIPEVLTYKEVEKLLLQPDQSHEIGARDLAILEVIYGSGIRVSELCHLKLYDVDDEYIKVFGKGRKERIVPIGRPAIKAVDYYLLHYRCNYDSEKLDTLFLTSRGRPIDRIEVWRRIKFYARQAGITKNISPHTLRHSFATHLLDNDADLRVIQEMMGHANISSTDKYLHVSKVKIQEAFYAFHPRG